jgi:hypothetical protein
MISEVTALLQRIDAEYTAACRGIDGLTSGTARHDFIVARMGNIEDARQQLISVIGDEHQAMTLIIQEIDKSSTLTGDNDDRK